MLILQGTDSIVKSLLVLVYPAMPLPVTTFFIIRFLLTNNITFSHFTSIYSKHLTNRTSLNWISGKANPLCQSTQCKIFAFTVTVTGSLHYAHLNTSSFTHIFWELIFYYLSCHGVNTQSTYRLLQFNILLTYNGLPDLQAFIWIHMGSNAWTISSSANTKFTGMEKKQGNEMGP